MLKQLLCKHHWVKSGLTIIAEGGATKVSKATCSKCNKTITYDIFSSFAKKVEVKRNDKL